MSFGGGGSGGGSVSGAADVFLSSPTSNQVLTYDGSILKWKNSTVAISSVANLQTELDTREVVVRWNANTHAWPARPAGASFGVVFLSTNDPNATPPTDANKQVGDLWRRHPDAS